MGAKGPQRLWFCPGAVPGDLALTCLDEDNWLPPCTRPVCARQPCPAPELDASQGDLVPG